MASTFALFTNLRCIILVFLIIAACVGLDGDQLRNDDNDQVYISLWEFKDATGTVTKVNDLGCSRLKERLRSGAALTIISIIFYFFMLVLAMQDLIRGPKKVVTFIYTFFNIVSFVFILVSWCLVAAIYHQKDCGNFVPKDNGFHFAYGFALLVTVWCAQILAEVMRLIASNSYDPADYDDEPRGQDLEEREKEIKRREAKKLRHAARREGAANNAPDANQST
eukprot:GILI01021313.1.p1 GENE.GILI01021313.1~~GILI01021313.1.p1  ORF type:complete len:223 (-),score=44.46 GILI01021313.1:212-880(-)